MKRQCVPVPNTYLEESGPSEEELVSGPYTYHEEA